MIKRIISRFILLSMLGTLIFLGIKSISNTCMLSADSGFDSSFDSGGSWGGGGSSSGGGSSWSSSSHSSSGGSGDLNGADVTIFLAIIFFSFVSGTVSAISHNNTHTDFSKPRTLIDRLYSIFSNVYRHMYKSEYDELRDMVTFDFYNKLLATNNDVIEQIITRDNTVVVADESSSSPMRVVLEFVCKAATFKKVNGNLERIDKDNLDQNKYLVEFINSDGYTWYINDVRKTFIQKVDYIPPSLDTKETEIKQVDISKYIPDKVQFLNDRFEDYKAIQIAWMDFDYDTLNDKLTNELYNQYEMQLETLKAKKQKNVMSGFNNKGMDITNLIEENDLITVIVSLNVVQKDYIEENGKCVRGDQYRDNIMNYRLTFVSRLDKDDKKCPNCGNPLEDISSQTCPSCRSLITLTPKKWVMSKKQVISQR